MAKINLLPWREERRKEQQRQFLTLLGLSVLLMVLVIVAVHLEYARSISVQNSRNAYLQKEIRQVEEQIKEITKLERDKQRLIDRIDKIQILQRNRPEVVHLFDEVVRIIPEGVYLSSLKQQGNLLTIEGLAQSNARVSAFMRGIDKSGWLKGPILDVIEAKNKKETKERSFKIRATQVSILAEEKLESDKAAKAARKRK